ncbi:GreA/GreB family elongation factor [Streptomyces sp. ICBB 8177]|uniref:GreA/GreB family elongation factor n=1 Tax=Streptomyces sp. ICBB 8177 TaxID=563922 RepID=UPI000D6748AF|nr:GreA/GreB family elongation factor [Streptomyces sp. ICBB 8177]PWI44860.1 nucleoside diphosphate kinase regulator [Streptomyces sp. ICBB 8177]
MTSQAAPISDDARQALERELAVLREERDAIAATVRDPSTDVGDYADRADELRRATELERLDARVDGLAARLRGAGTAGPPDPDRVGIGSSVTVEFADGSRERVDIVEVVVPSDAPLVTDDSPLGKALLGRRVGDRVEYSAPDGDTTARIVSLDSRTS